MKAYIFMKIIERFMRKKISDFVEIRIFLVVSLIATLFLYLQLIMDFLKTRTDKFCHCFELRTGALIWGFILLFWGIYSVFICLTESNEMKEKEKIEFYERERIWFHSRILPRRTIPNSGTYSVVCYSDSFRKRNNLLEYFPRLSFHIFIFCVQLLSYFYPVVSCTVFSG